MVVLKDIAQFENIYDEMRIKFHKHQKDSKSNVFMNKLKDIKLFRARERTMAHVMLSGTDGVETQMLSIKK